MAWMIWPLAAMVGGGLYLAVASFMGSRNEAPTQALDRLEQMAAAAAQHNPLMPSLSQAAAELGIKQPWWRTHITERARRNERVAQLNERSVELADLLDRADLQFRPHEWYASIAGAGFLFALLALLRFNWVVALVVLIVVPTVGGQFFLRFRIGRRLRAVDAQLSDVLILMGNGLRAGYSFAQALNAVASQARPPLGKDLSRVRAEIELGVPVDDALRHFAERVPTEDIDLVVTAVAVTRVLGGNLAQILDVIATTVRERVRIQGEIRTLTAQARTSGWIVTLLPFGLSGILLLVAPDYFGKMLTDPIGIGMLIGSVFSMLIGGLIIRNIVTIDV